jgi:hypothetical protein
MQTDYHRHFHHLLCTALALAALELGSAFLPDAWAAAWVANGPMVTRRSGHTATLLPTGKLLVAGGYTVQSVA